MAYSKKIWGPAEALNLANLQHMDGQYSAIIADLATHIDAGHPTVYRPKSDMDQYFWHAGNDGHGSGLDADTLEGTEAASIVGGVDPGIMCWWYPENGPIPSGFLFCDGSNGTMDMRLRYPIGASSTISVNQAVGNSVITPLASATVGSCTLTVPNIFHTHQGEDDYDYAWNQDSGYSSVAKDTIEITINTSSVGGGGSHVHPGIFTGTQKNIDPLFKYLVIIQKS